MSLMGYGKMAGIGATIGAGALAGGGLLATGEAIKGTKYVGSHATSQLGSALTYAGTNISGEPKTRIQELATSIGAKMTTAGYRGLNKNNNSNLFILKYKNLKKNNQPKNGIFKLSRFNIINSFKFNIINVII